MWNKGKNTGRLKYYLLVVIEKKNTKNIIEFVLVWNWVVAHEKKIKGKKRKCSAYSRTISEDARKKE